MSEVFDSSLVSSHVLPADFSDENLSAIKHAILKAYDAADEIKVEATQVVEYQSRGKVLVIGSADDIARFGDLPEPLVLQAIIINEEDIKKGGKDSEVASHGAKLMSRAQINGALGDYLVHLNIGDSDTKELPAMHADLIVDMGETPQLSMPIKPPGYFHVNWRTDDLDALKTELPGLVGTFEKPRYFSYDENKCAHGRSGKPGCTRCLDACPTEAISSLINKISVDPFRCQGGGICATVCPSGAIQYSYPKPLDLLKRIRLMIKSFLVEIDFVEPVLVIAAESSAKQAQDYISQFYPQSLLVIVEESASVGLEVWFSALAWGAHSIVIFEPDEIPVSTFDAFKLNIKTAQLILSAMGYSQNRVSLWQGERQEPDAENSTVNSFTQVTKTSPATHAALSDKRQAFYLALDHLYQQAQLTKNMSRAISQVALPEGAIFGNIHVDPEACTLCMSCVSSCPANALQDGRDLPQLGFIESKCLQCNICVNTCPENALSTSPRFVLDKDTREQVRILHQEAPFCCISCGKPFATQSGISTILGKLMGHPMFATERSRNRLKMCEDCRVKDMMDDPDADF